MTNNVWKVEFILSAMFFIILVIPSCTKKAGKFRLADGRVVQCKFYNDDYCGMSLYDCDSKEEYRCQTNVTRIYDAQ